MFAYCFNNPVNMSDPDGNWPKWVNKVVNAVKKAVKTVTKWVNKAKKKIKKVCGFTTQVDKEVSTVSKYRGVVSYETGTGYNKQFDTGKSVNVYHTIPNISEDIFDAGIGIDVNINGYGASMQTGAEDSFSINLPNQSFEWGGKPFGRNYFKHSYIDSSGIYVYNKFTVNSPELVAGALIWVYVPGAAKTATAGAALRYAFE